MLNDSLRDRRTAGASVPQSDDRAPARASVFGVLLGALSWAAILTFCWACAQMVSP